MKRLVKVTMTITLMFMVINSVNAQQGPRNVNRQGQGYGQGYSLEHGLNLSDEQQETMKTMHLKLQKDIIPVRNALGENKAKLRTLTTSENVDMKAVNKLIDSNGQLSANLAKLIAANHQEIRKMLTDEQRILFDSRDFERNDRSALGQRGERGQRGPKRSGQGQGQGHSHQGKF